MKRYIKYTLGGVVMMAYALFAGGVVAQSAQARTPSSIASAPLIQAQTPPVVAATNDDFRKSNILRTSYTGAKPSDNNLKPLPALDNSGWTAFDTDAIAELDDITTAAAGGSKNHDIQAVVTVGDKGILNPLAANNANPQVEVVGGGNNVAIGNTVVLIFGDPDGISNTLPLSVVWSAGSAALLTLNFTPSSTSDDRASLILRQSDIDLLNDDPRIIVRAGSTFPGFGGQWGDPGFAFNPEINIIFPVVVSSEEGVTVSIVISGDDLRTELSRTPDGSITYQWQQRTIDGGFADIASANSATYTPTLNAIVGFGPVFGVVVTYQSGSGANVDAELLTPVTVFGIANPEVAAALTNPSSGEYAIDLTGLTDPLGRAINETYVSYEWQSGASAQDGFGAIAGETSRTYTADAADFAGGKRFIRAVITDLAGVSSPIALTGLNIGDLADSDLRFSGRFIVGETLTADTSRLSGGYTYSWQGSSDNGGNYSEIGTGNTYIVAIGDFANVRTNSAIARIRLVATPTGGGAAITSADLSYAPPQVEITYRYTSLYASISDDILHSTISLDITEDVDASGYTYQWRVYRTDINSGTESTRQLTQTQHLQLCCSNRGKFSGSDEQLISVLVEVLDPLGGALQTPTPQGGEDGSIRFDRAGSVRISLTEGVGGLQAGSKLAVYLDDINGAISDNGAADETLYSLEWFSDGVVLTTYRDVSVDNNNNGRFEARSDYILTEADITSLAIIRARVDTLAGAGLWADTLGFDNDGFGTITLTAPAVGIAPPLTVGITHSGNGVLQATLSRIQTGVRYVWTEGSGDSFAPIDGAANAATYTVPTIYDAEYGPLVGVNAIYTNNSGEEVAAVLIAPLSVVGIGNADATVGILGDGLTLGALYTVDISDLEDPLGRSLDASHLDYQWLVGPSNNLRQSGRTDTLAIYTLNESDFSSSQTHLGVEVNHKNATAAKIRNTDIMQIIHAPSGTPTLIVSGFAPGGVISIGINNFDAPNGGGLKLGGSFGGIQWFIGPDRNNINLIPDTARRATYTIKVADFAGAGASPFIRVAGIEYSNPFDFTVPLAGNAIVSGTPVLELTLTQTAPTGDVLISGSNIAAGGEWVADVSGVSDVNGEGTFTYQWQGGSGASFTDATDGTGATFILGANWNGAEELRLLVRHTDPFGAVSNLQATNTETIAADTTGNIDIDGTNLGFGGTLTAAVNLSDANGAGTAQYQWARRGDASGTFAEIDGATNNTYIITADDAAGSAPQLRLSVLYTDALGFTASFLSTADIERSVFAVQINGNFAVGETLTAAESGFIGAITYAWHASTDGGSNFTPITGENAQTYIVATADFAGATVAAQIQVVVSGVSGTSANAIMTYSPATAVGGIIDIDESGLDIGAILAADISGLTNTNAASRYSYQWARRGSGTGEFTNISGATDNTYTIAAADAAGRVPQLRLLVLHTDALGFTTSFLSNPVNVASALQINGRFIAGATLTADISRLPGSYTYSWQGSSDGGGNYTEIGTSDTYIVAVGDFASVRTNGAIARIRLIATTASGGTALSYIAADLSYTPPQVSVTYRYTNLHTSTAANIFHSTISLDITEDVDASGYSYQWRVYKGGNPTDLAQTQHLQLCCDNRDEFSSSGEQLISVLVSVLDPLGGALQTPLPQGEEDGSIRLDRAGSVRISLTESVGGLQVGDSLAIYLDDINGVSNEGYNITWFGESSNNLKFESGVTAANNGRLEARSDYILTADDITRSGRDIFVLVDIDAGGAGWIDTLGFVNNNRGDIRLSANLTPIVLISGNFAVGEELTAEAINLGDSVNYQWQASTDGGSNFTPIAGATTQNYTVDAADFAGATTLAQIQIVASSGSESATATMIYSPTLVGGNITIDESGLGIGAIVTANISGLTNADDAATYTYQWARSDEAGNFTNITGAINNTYIIITIDVVESAPQLRLSVLYADALGYTVSFLSAPVNVERPVVAVQISGDFVIGETLTAVASQFIGNVTYEWRASTDGGNTFTPITDETAQTYIVDAADFAGAAVPAQIQVVASSGIDSANAIITYTPVGGDISVIIGGRFRVNEVLSAVVNIGGLGTGAGTGGYTYQWFQSSNGGGDFAEISGETGGTYAVDASDFALEDEQVAHLRVDTNIGAETVTSIVREYEPPDISVTYIGDIYNSYTPQFYRGGIVRMPISIDNLPAGASVTYRWQRASRGRDNNTDFVFGGELQSPTNPVYTGIETISGSTARGFTIDIALINYIYQPAFVGNFPNDGSARQRISSVLNRVAAIRGQVVVQGDLLSRKEVVANATAAGGDETGFIDLVGVSDGRTEIELLGGNITEGARLRLHFRDRNGIDTTTIKYISWYYAGDGPGSAPFTSLGNSSVPLIPLSPTVSWTPSSRSDIFTSQADYRLTAEDIARIRREGSINIYGIVTYGTTFGGQIFQDAGWQDGLWDEEVLDFVNNRDFQNDIAFSTNSRIPNEFPFMKLTLPLQLLTMTIEIDTPNLTLTVPSNISLYNIISMQWQQGGGDSFDNIDGENGFSYEPPQIYNADFGPSVRVSIVYEDNLTTRITTNSLPYAVFGVSNLADIAPTLQGDGIIVGAEYSFNPLAGVLDATGRSVNEEHGLFTYIWQTGDAAGNFTDINNATLTSYALVADDFLAGQISLQAVIINRGHLGGLNTRLTVATVPIDVLATANVIIGGVAALGQTLTLSITDIRDANSGNIAGTLDSYQWARRENTGAVFSPVTGATSDTYTVSRGDYAGTNPQIRASGQHTDVFGFTTQLFTIFSPVSPLGDIQFNGDYTPDTQYNIVLSPVVQNLIDDSTIKYQWLGDNDINDDTPGAELSGEEAAAYILQAASWNTAYTFLQVRVKYVSNADSSVVAQFLSPAVSIPQAASGAAVVELLGSEFEAGVTLSANVSDIDDLNGVGTFTYVWSFLGDATPLTDNTAQLYQIKAADIAALESGRTLQVSVTHADKLGYENNVTADYTILFADFDISGAVLAANIRQSNSTGVYTYQWLQSAAEHNIASYAPIDGATAASYAVPPAYDATKPFMRLSVGYNVSGVSRDLFAYSAARRVAGIASGALAITIVFAQRAGEAGVFPGVFPGDTWRADTSNLIDVLGRPVHLGALTYEWQALRLDYPSSLLSDSSLTLPTPSLATGIRHTMTIGRATGATLTVQSDFVRIPAAGSFVLSHTFRVVVEDVAGLRTTMTYSPFTDGPLLNQDTIGKPTIFVRGSTEVITTNIEVGTELTAGISGLDDPNGVGTFTYQWSNRCNDESRRVDINGATLDVYTVRDEDACGSQTQNIIEVRIMHIEDQLGFDSRFQVSRNRLNSQIVRIVKGSPVTVSIAVAGNEVFAALSRSVGGAEYVWEEGSGSSFTDAGAGSPRSSQRYTLPTTYDSAFGPFVRLRFRLGGETTVTAPLRVVGVSNPDASLPLTSVAASVIQVDISALRDPINRAVDTSLLTYQWQVGNAAGVYNDISGQTAATYTPNPSHFDIDNDITFLRVQLTDRSGLAAEAFHSIAADLAFGLRDPQILGEFTAGSVLSVDIAGDRSGITYEWERSLDGGTNFVSIPGATLSIYAVQPGNFAGAGEDFAAIIRVILKSALAQFPSAPRQYIPPTRNLQAELVYDSLIIGTTANVYSTVAVTIRNAPSDASISYFWEVVRGETLRIGTDTTPQLGLFNDGSSFPTYILGNDTRHTLRAAVSVVSSFGGVQRITLAETVIEREGEIAIALDNNEELFIGSQINAIVSDTNGVATENYTIQWIVGGEVRDISWSSPPLAVSVTTNNYTLTEEDITNLATTPQISVRILLSSADGFLDSLRNINDGVAATITVTPVPALQVTLGIASGEVSATLSRALSTAEGEVQYVWEEGDGTDGDFEIITDAILGAYLPPPTYAADFGPYIRVRVTYDYGGTTSTSVNSAGLRVVGVATIAEVNNISGDGVAVGSTYTFTHSGLTDPLGRGVDSSLLNYQWYSSNSADSSSVAIAGATDAAYVLAADVFDNNSPGLFLRVTDKSGLATASISSPTLNLSRAASGQPLIEVVGGGSSEAGATLQVSGGVADENGVGAFSGYSWTGNNSENVGTPQSNGSELVLNDTAVNVLGGGGAVEVTLTHTDGLGFTTPFIVSFRQLAVALSLNAGTDSVDALVEDTNGISTGSYTYQWQRSATESGGYTNVDGANDASYAVSQDNIAEPFVRVNVGYILTFNSAPSQASSRGVRAVGIDSSGAVSATGGGVIIGATRTADISDIEDLFGRAVPSNYLTYQWQVSDSENGTYSDISGAESQTYALAAGDFADGKSFLRVQVESAVVGDSYADESVGDNIERTATGAISIDGTDYRPGGIFTANTDSINDDNGTIENTYQWSQDSGGGFGNIDSATNASYTVDAADFTGSGISPTLQVIVTHADAFGFTTNFTTAVQFTNADTTGTIGIVVTGYMHDDVLTLSHNVADANAGATPVELVNIAWQRRAGDSDSFVADISETGDTYTIDRAHWAPQDMLRVVAEYVDPFGAQISLTASAVLINQPTQGATQVTIVGGGEVSAGKALRAITSSITDENGSLGYDFQWFGGAPDKSSAQSETYNLTNEDIGAIENGNAVGVEVVHTDDFGFVTTLTATLTRVVVALSRSGAIFTAVPDDSGISDGDYSYQWQQSETASGTYVAITDATNSTYTVPSDYDASREHLRVSVDYTITDGSVAAFVLSRSTVVAGINSGIVEVTGDGSNIGAGRTADISSLLNVLGQPVQPGQVRYQWQVGSAVSGDDSYSNIDGATSRVYTLATADFDDSNRYLRVRIIDLADEGNTRDSVGELLDQSSAGTISIEGTDHHPGGVLSVDISDITDENGIGTYAYTWARARTQHSQNFDDLGDTNTYTVQADRFGGSGETPRVRIAVVHTDPFGFSFTFMLTVQFINTPPTGGISISGASYAVGDTLTLSNNIADDNAGTVSIVLSSISWQRREGDSGDFVAIADETGNTYTIDGDDWSPHNMLRAVADYVDPFGARTAGYTAAAVDISRPPIGQGRIIVVGGGSAAVSSTLRLTASIADENGNGGVGGYVWTADTGTPQSEGELVLNTGGVSILEAGGAISVTFTHTDALGFTTPFAASFRQLAVAASLNVGANSIDASIDDGNNISTGSGYTYQWQQSATEGGVYTDISDAATASVYSVPTDYDISKPYIRVEVGYQLAVEGTRATVFSGGVRAVEIGSGVVSFATGGEVTIGATRTADISGIEDLFGRAVPDNYLTYQWQAGNSLAGGYTNINGATSRTYALAADDFDNDRRFLRVQVRSAIAGDIYTALSGGEDIERASSAEAVSIDGTDYRPDGIFTANTDSVTDANGAVTHVYQWLQDSGDGFAEIDGETNATYAVDVTDFAGSGISPTLQVIVTHTDVFGFVATSTATAQFTNTDSGGDISISGDSYAVGNVLTLSHSITDENRGTVDIVLVDIEWQQRTGNSGDFAAIDSGSETGNTYTIDAADWAPQDMLRAVAVYVDPFGARTGYTVAAVVEINQPTRGELRIEVVGGGLLIEGATLQVNTENVSDGNGTESIDGYQWVGSGGDISGATDATYTLTEADIAAAQSGGAVGVGVVHTDGLGFVVPLNATFRQVLVTLTSSGATLTAGVNDVDTISNGAYTYQWQQSETANGDYVAIPAATNSIYIVAGDYDASREHLRVRVDYIITNGGAGAFSLSRSTVVAGIVGGSVSVTGDDFGAGATRTADISSLRSVLGQEVQAEQVGYQWQVGSAASGDDSYSNIGDATLRVYTLATADFNDSDRYLRVRIIDLANESNTRDSVGELIEQPSTGDVSIDGNTFAPSGEFTANTDGVTDTNGIGTYTYQWSQDSGGSFGDIIGATNATYTVDAADLSGSGETPLLRVIVTHTDAFGFITTSTATVQFTNAATTGDISINVTGYARDDVLTLSHNIADANAGTIGIALVDIEWQQRTGDSGDFVAIDSGSETGNTYTIDVSHWAPRDMLRAVAFYVDPFGARTGYTAAVVDINRPPSAQTRIIVVGSGSAAVDSTLRLTANITDENGESVLSNHSWTDDVGTPQSDGTELVLNTIGVSVLEAGGAVSLTFTHTDRLGFATLFTVSFRQLAVAVSLNAAANRIDAKVDDDNNVSSGIYAYQWQQSATAGGEYNDIPDATTASTYTVSTNYDISKPYIRVEVGYELTAESIQATVSSEGIRAVGIATDSVVSFPTGGVAVGATRTASISDIEDLFGREARSNYFTYQWQVGDSLSGNYNDISGATSQTYALAADDFDDGESFLRVQVRSAVAGDSYTADSVGEDIERTSTGGVSIDGNTFAPDGEFTANTGGVTDENGAVTHAYQWLQDSGDGFGEIDGETDATYTVDAADFIGSGISPTLQVIVTHTDVFGFIATSTAAVQFINAASGGDISISGDSYAVNDVLTLSHSITDDNRGTVGIELVDIEWQQRTGDSGDFAAIDSGSETGNTYTIDATDWMPHDMLRAVAFYVDPFGARTGYTVAAVVEINRATRGELRIEVVGSDEPVAGTVLQVITANVSDGNGTDSIDNYQWIDGNGDEISGATGATYTLTADDILAAQSGNAVGIRAVHTDGLGFVATLTATFRQVLVTLARSGASSTFTANVEDRDNIDNGDYRYQWQQSETANGDYINIAGAGSRSYTVPSGYDASREHLRVSVSYTITNGGADAFSLSRSTVVAGIVSGSVSVPSGGFAVGARRTAIIDNLSSVLNQQVQAAQVRYQWQVGSAASGDDSYSNISGATLRVYTLATADFTDSNRYLRVRIIDLADENNTRDSVGELIEQPSTGAVSIGGNNFAPGGVFTANTGRVGDNNGIGAYTYQWSQESSGSFGDISGATNASYTVDAADLSGSGETPLLRVIVTHTDAFGFITTSTATVQFTNTDSAGDISISGDSYEAGDVLTLSHSVTDVNAGTVGIELVDIEWQQRTGDSGDFVAIADETGNTYAIDATDWSPHDMLRAVAVYVDPFGARTGYTASVVEINRPTSEGLQIEVVGGGEPLEGTTLQVITANVSDGNGTESIGDYQWINGSGGEISGQTETTYILTAADITAMQSGNAVGIRAVHTDGLGFVVTLNATFRQVLVNLVLNRFTFTANPDDVDDIDNGDYRFQWQQSDEADGVYTNIAGAGSRSYTVPSSYDASREHLRVSVSYTITNGNIAAFSYSRSTVVAGIDSGNVLATGNGFGANARRTANISSLRSVLGQSVQAAQVGYQWQVSDAENGTYSDISGEESQTYALAVADFTDSNRYLRVRIIDLADESNTLDSDGEEIEQPSTGVLSIDGSNFAPGGVFTANTRGVRDANGTGTYDHQWMRGDGALIAGETDETYTLAVSDFSGITTPDLRLVAVHTDAFGFVVTLTSGITVNIQNAATGNIVINTSAGYAHNDVLILQPNIRDANAGTVAIELVGIRWQRRTGDSGSFADIDSEIGNTYTIDRGDWAPQDMLRAVAFYDDPFGARTGYTAAVVEINQPTRGNINVEVVGDGEPVASATLTVITSGLTDANDFGSITYQWFNGNSVAISGQTNTTYVITSMDVLLAEEQNKPLAVRVLYTDGLGFITTLSASFEPIAIEQEQLEEISGVLDVGAISEAVNVIGKHLSQVSGGAIGGGGDIGDEPQTYLEVNGVALESAQDISHAFSRRTSDSLQSDEAFRLDEFKVAYSGTDDSGASWSSWAQGGWSKLSGAPVVNDEVLKYDGNSFGVFVGADREFGESVRAGVAVGINKTEIDLDLNADGELDDKVTRKLNSILPYLEWRGAGSRGNLLLLGGYGVGELETELPNCRGNVDVEWLMASLQGKYSVPLTIGWDIVLNGGANISNSSSEKGTCGSSRELPGSESNTGEGSLGLDTVWTSRLANGGTIRPYVSFGARMAYGDLESKAAYDLGGGINVAFPAGLSFGIDGKRQINNTEHNRDSINGVLAFDYGAYKSSLTTTYNIADNKEGLVHRWEFNRISEWGVNTINSGIYVQRNAIDSNATGSAGLHVKMEWK